MSETRSGRAHPLSGWRQPLVTAVGMAVAVALVATVDPRPGPLILVAVLAMTLSRSRLNTSWRGLVEALVLLPVLGVATAAVGELLRVVPVVGALLFVLAMFLGVWLRRFGATWTRVGSLIALPFLTLIIVPGGGAGTTVWSAAVLALVALLVVVVIRVLAEVTRLVPRASKGTVDFDQRASSLRPVASTRMAIQLAIALVAAFVVGALIFPDHVTWVVLTAYLVCSGNRGRADVLYKSGLRVLGAAAGTVVAFTGLAALVRTDVAVQGPALVAILLVLVGIGLWLRTLTYAAWALVVTLVITLLQGVAATSAAIPVTTMPAAGPPTSTVLWERVLAIIVGAAFGLAASWFVLPVRSEPVVRRRIADTLVALGDFLADPTPRADTVLGARLDRLDEIAGPWRALDRATPRRRSHRTPAMWISLVHESARLARSRSRPDAAEPAPDDLRRVLGKARSSLREPDAIGPALIELRDALAAEGRMDP